MNDCDNCRHGEVDGDSEPFHMKLSECIESVKLVLNGTIPKHEG